MGRGSDVRNVWACVGDVENDGTVAPTLLDSLAEDLCRVEPDNEPSRDPTNTNVKCNSVFVATVNHMRWCISDKSCGQMRTVQG